MESLVCNFSLCALFRLQASALTLCNCLGNHWRTNVLVTSMAWLRKAGYDPRYNKADPFYLLTRREQLTAFRLRTGHNRFNYHLYSKLRIGYTEQCHCGAGSQTTEHLLQSYPIYEPLRKRNLARRHSRSPQALR